MNEGPGNVCRDALMSAHKAYWTSRSCADLESDANCYRVMSLCRGFSIQRCIMLKHLSKEAEETLLGSQSPPAKRPCSDLQVNHKLKPSPAPPQKMCRSRPVQRIAATTVWPSLALLNHHAVPPCFVFLLFMFAFCQRKPHCFASPMCKTRGQY